MTDLTRSDWELGFRNADLGYTNPSRGLGDSSLLHFIEEPTPGNWTTATSGDGPYITMGTHHGGSRPGSEAPSMPGQATLEGLYSSGMPPLPCDQGTNESADYPWISTDVLGIGEQLPPSYLDIVSTDGAGGCGQSGPSTTATSRSTISNSAPSTTLSDPKPTNKEMKRAFAPSKRLLTHNSQLRSLPGPSESSPVTAAAGRAPCPSSEEWYLKQPIIAILYLKDRLDLKSVIAVMKAAHGFTAT